MAKNVLTDQLSEPLNGATTARVDINNTYQSSGFDSAANKVEITLQSGAGNVSVNIGDPS